MTILNQNSSVEWACCLNQSSSFELPNWLNKMAMSIPWSIVGTATSTGQTFENPGFPEFCTFFMHRLNFSWHFTLFIPENKLYLHYNSHCCTEGGTNTIIIYKWIEGNLWQWESYLTCLAITCSHDKLKHKTI